MSKPLTDSESQQLWWNSLSEEFKNGMEDVRMHEHEGWPYTFDAAPEFWQAQSVDYRAGYEYGKSRQNA